jgi:hypothetical protein
MLYARHVCAWGWGVDYATSGVADTAKACK